MPGASLDWRAPWSGGTPADIARSVPQEHMVAWLESRSGH